MSKGRTSSKVWTTLLPLFWLKKYHEQSREIKCSYHDLQHVRIVSDFIMNLAPLESLEFRLSIGANIMKTDRIAEKHTEKYSRHFN